MDDAESLSQFNGKRKYHIFFIPKLSLQDARSAIKTSHWYRDGSPPYSRV